MILRVDSKVFITLQCILSKEQTCFWIYIYIFAVGCVLKFSTQGYSDEMKQHLHLSASSLRGSSSYNREE